ncbi:MULTISPECIES: thioredoxin domain-containing protein [unclassified Crossiella]|uniref:DsbA family protein n=1 Tax=unclassified Crossiella TaxID=2620835 RepID=UPI001FFECF0C|nr:MULTISPECIES: thioredoxin domain-containing protein [unclassified Crossiella]MCK2240808.1 DsbA family protein [Crossiella sp. S99.2]MCK2254048.1 DsbA family protein [Crossiella sp. S99.1]
MSQPQPDQPETQSAARPAWQLALPAIVVVAGVLLAYLALGRTGGDTPTADAPAPTASDTAAPQTPNQSQMDAAARQLDSRFTRRREGDPYAKGRVDAPVVMVEYADYRCPYCAKFSTDTRPELVRRYVDQGLLRIEWRDLPMFGAESEAAAVAARAAARQGRFWPFHELAFAEAPRSGHAEFGPDRLRDLARRSGVADMAKFERDLADPVLRQEIRTDAAESQEMGLTSTPAFLINGRAVVGAQPLETFVRLIEQAAKK